MQGHVAHILIVIARLATGTLLVPLAVIAGVMTTPTTCQCGAELPHAHALFGVTNHYHGNVASQSDRDDSEVVTSGQDSVTVQAPAGSALQAFTALNAYVATLLSIPLAGVPSTPTHIPDGLRAAPDVPPPRA